MIRKVLRKFSKVLVHLVCATCFLVLAYESITKYIEKSTSVSVTYLPITTQKLPSLVFCPDTPYIPNTTWSADITKYATTMPKISFLSIYVMENFTEIFEDPFHYTYLDTVYNGRCQLLESDITLTPGTYVKLNVEEKELSGTKLWLYVYHQGHDVHMIYQMWGTVSVAVAHLRSSASISIFTEMFEYLQDVKNLNCRGQDLGGEAKCVNREVKKTLESENHQCIPTHLRVLHGIKAQFCEHGQEETARKALLRGMSIMDGARRSGTCKPPCHAITYRLLITELNHITGTPFMNYTKEGQRTLYLNFPSKMDVTRKQYYIHDKSSLLSALGGGVGLFLGLSCLGGALTLIDMISKRFSTLEYPTKLSV